MDGIVSTHSRPKAAGSETANPLEAPSFQHTAARRRLAKRKTGRPTDYTFQHTAARRRLAERSWFDYASGEVSTHSRPKAAGYIITLIKI